VLFLETKDDGGHTIIERDRTRPLKETLNITILRLNCYELKLFFVKEFLHTFGNPATFMATPQYLINASATASVSTPNSLIK